MPPGSSSDSWALAGELISLGVDCLGPAGDPAFLMPCPES